MSIGEDVYTALSGNAGLSALISNRIYPNQFPQDVTLPGVVYFQQSDNPVNFLGSEATLKNVRYEFECWSETYSEAQSVADALESAVAAASTFKSYRVIRQDGYEPELALHRITVDYSIWQ